MRTRGRILDEVREALESVAAVDVHRHPVALDYADGVLTLEGEVGSVAAKKLALRAAAAHPAVTGVVDRLRVAPAERMGDGEIADRLRDAFLQEPAFAEHAIRGSAEGRPPQLYQNPEAGRGVLDFAVAEGVVTLNGRVLGLDEKRLAGVLAWWVPGARDIVNGIAIDPPEADSPDAIADAVRLVLEKDPFVDAGQIRIGVRDCVVFLEGTVASAAERDMAENDAWYVFGVDRVVNSVEVRP